MRRALATTTLGLLTLVALPAAARPPASRPAVTLEVIARDGWGARPAKDTLVPHTITRLSVHHSGAPLKDNRRAPDRLRSAQEYHQVTKGWPDLAYHFLVDGAGNVYEGRTTAARGDSHTPYDTSGHFLVCLVGDYDQVQPQPAQLEAIARLLAWAATRFKVKAATIAGHRDVARTSCPGKHLYARIKDGSLRQRVERLLAEGGVAMKLVAGAEARRRVSEIRRGPR